MLPRMIGALGRECAGRIDFMRGRELTGLAALTRPDMPSRCTLPITALRVMPLASSWAIWLALNPSSQSLRKSSTRSSVQDIKSSSICLKNEPERGPHDAAKPLAHLGANQTDAAPEIRCR